MGNMSIVYKDNSHIPLQILQRPQVHPSSKIGSSPSLYVFKLLRISFKCFFLSHFSNNHLQNGRIGKIKTHKMHIKHTNDTKKIICIKLFIFCIFLWYILMLFRIITENNYADLTDNLYIHPRKYCFLPHLEALPTLYYKHPMTSCHRKKDLC